MTGPIRTLVVDDQPMVRAGLRVVLDNEPDIEVVGEAGDGIEAQRIALRDRPDVILMDVRMPRVDGVAATRAIRSKPALAHSQVIVLTTFDDDEYVVGSLLAGAAGFLLKDALPVELLASIRRVHAGGSALDPAITRRIVDQWMAHQRRAAAPEANIPIDRVSPRELDVWRRVARGHSNREIARALFLTEGTVKTHVHALLTKLGATSRTHLAVMAYESGLVSPGDGDD